jgi:predicted nuclease with TOPRIM domain
MSCEKHSELVTRIESLEGSVKELYKRITTREIESGRFDEKLNGIKATLDDLVIKVSVLASQPAARWNTLITVLITAAASGVIGAALAKLF